MNRHELPQMSATSYTSNTTAWEPAAIGSVPRRVGDLPAWEAAVKLAAYSRMAAQQQSDFVIEPPHTSKPKSEPSQKETKMAETTTPARRLVQVFIADPDINVPLDKALLYSGEQQMTDLSDQELFFEIDMAGILKRHNELRGTLTDKSVKSKTVHLEPARIRDLRMTVVTIASF